MKPFIMCLACFYVHAAEPNQNQTDTVSATLTAGAFYEYDPNDENPFLTGIKETKQRLNELAEKNTEEELKNTTPLTMNFWPELSRILPLLKALLDPTLTYGDGISLMKEYTEESPDYFKNLAKEIYSIFYDNDILDRLFKGLAWLELKTGRMILNVQTERFRFSTEQNNAYKTANTDNLTKDAEQLNLRVKQIQKYCLVQNLIIFLIYEYIPRIKQDKGPYRTDMQFKRFIDFLAGDNKNSMLIPIQQIFFLHYITDLLLLFHKRINEKLTEGENQKLFSETFWFRYVPPCNIHLILKHAVYMIEGTYQEELND